jgi:hypothetical protein
MKIDFCHYLLNYAAGDAIPDLSTVRCDQASKGAHRHRQEDLLGLLLTIRGDHRYQSEELNELAELASSLFFQQQGSVTRAIQVCFDEVNKKILDRNLDRGYEGIRAEGSLNIAVMHQENLFIGQAGETYSLFIGRSNYNQWGETGENETSLGTSKRYPIRFYQSEIEVNDLVILAPNLPHSWNAQNLAGSADQPMAIMKRRLLNQVMEPLNALVIQFREGRGRSIPCTWEDEPASVTLQEPEVEASHPTDTLDLHKPQVSDLPTVEDVTLSSQSGDNDNKEEEKSSDLNNRIEIEAIREPAIALGAGEIPINEGQTEKPVVESGGVQTFKKPSRFTLTLAQGWIVLKAFKKKIEKILNPLGKSFPQKAFSRLSPARDAIRLILTISLPVVFILASTTVYSQYGKKEQHQIYLEEAQTFTDLALVEKNAQKQREYWVQALDFAMKAEEYGSTQESRLVFNQAQSTLDEMDLVKRLDFRPALTQYFPEGVVISQIQASSSGVFLLDNTTGSLLRVFLNSKGFYELDQEFSCAPGPYGLTNVSKLIDFVLLPANKENYKILALDGSGNLLYCRPGTPPVSRTLPEPEAGWEKIIGVAYDQDILYVLDADRDLVWMYKGKDPDKPELSGIVFSEAPLNFFDSDIPDLGGAMDLSVNQEDLYILHQDGHMTVCQYSPLKEVKKTECKEPFPYTDNRVGHEKHPLIFTGTQFTMLQQARLPNAALYMLELNSRSVFQFSFQMNLEQTLKVQPNKNYPVPGSPPSGFGISPEQDIFLAFDNQLFVAPLR